MIVNLQAGGQERKTTLGTEGPDFWGSTRHLSNPVWAPGSGGQQQQRLGGQRGAGAPPALRGSCCCGSGSQPPSSDPVAGGSGPAEGRSIVCFSCCGTGLGWAEQLCSGALREGGPRGFGRRLPPLPGCAWKAWADAAPTKSHGCAENVLPPFPSSS